MSIVSPEAGVDMASDFDAAFPPGSYCFEPGIGARKIAVIDYQVDGLGIMHSSSHLKCCAMLLGSKMPTQLVPSAGSSRQGADV